MTTHGSNVFPPVQRLTGSGRRPNLPMAGGVLFTGFFVASQVLGGALASSALPLPGAPAAEVARYYADNGTAALWAGAMQVLSALSLFVFVAAVVSAMRQAVGERRGRHRVAISGGVLAAFFLLVSALLTTLLAVAVTAWGLDLVDTLRTLSFLTGGAAHVVSLGLFVGAVSLEAARARVLPNGIRWLGTVAAVLATLSSVSVVWFPASILLPIGRLLCLIWSVAAGIALTMVIRRIPAVEG